MKKRTHIFYFAVKDYINYLDKTNESLGMGANTYVIYTESGVTRHLKSI